MTLLTACQAGGSNVVVTALCPEPKEYSAADQQRASAELRALPRGSMIGQLVADYGNLREQLRACAGDRRTGDTQAGARR